MVHNTIYRRWGFSPRPEDVWMYCIPVFPAILLRHMQNTFASRCFIVPGMRLHQRYCNCFYGFNARRMHTKIYCLPLLSPPYLRSVGPYTPPDICMASLKRGLRAFLAMRYNYLLKMKSHCGSLAQLVEQRTLNPSVERSSRSRPTNKNNRLALSRASLFCFIFLPWEYDCFLSASSAPHAR